MVKVGGFEFLDHPADVYIRAWGNTLEEAFSYAGLALFEVMIDTSKVTPVQSRELKVEGIDLEQLLYNWLEELLLLFVINRLACSEFSVEYIQKIEDQYVLKAVVRGEPFNLEKHGSRTEVKSPTYSLMEINSLPDGGYELKFVLDI